MEKRRCVTEVTEQDAREEIHTANRIILDFPIFIFKEEISASFISPIQFFLHGCNFWEIFEFKLLLFPQKQKSRSTASKACELFVYSFIRFSLTIQ